MYNVPKQTQQFCVWKNLKIPYLNSKKNYHKTLKKIILFIINTLLLKINITKKIKKNVLQNSGRIFQDQFEPGKKTRRS